MSDAETAYKATEAEIERIRANGGARLDLSGEAYNALTWLPDSIAQLTSLTSLVLRGTQVSDLTPIAPLTGLTTVDLSGTQVSDLTPIALLTALTALDLNGTQVSDLTPIAQLTALTYLELRNTQVSDLTPIAPLTALTWLGLANTQVSDLTPIAPLIALTQLDLNGTQVSDLRPLTALRKLAESPMGMGSGLLFKNTVATRLDPRIAEIAEISNKKTRVLELFAYLEDWEPPGLSIPAASPAPLMVKIEGGRMRRTGSGDLPENDAMTRAEMGWAALKAYRDSFGGSFNVHNYAPLPMVLAAFDTAMGEVFDPRRMILIGVMGTRIVNLSDDRSLLDTLPDGAETDLRGFAAQISIFLNRFPDWVTYLEEAEGNDATAEAVKAELTAFDEFRAALAETGMVDSEVTWDFATELAIAAGDDADATAAKGLTASTRELARELTEAAFEGLRTGQIARMDIESMNQIADGEFAKFRLWTYGWPLVVLKRKQAPLRRLAKKFPARLGWLGPILDYLIGADEDR